jgi:hypothetical protein
LFGDLVAVAARHGRAHFNGVVATSSPLPKVDPADLVAAWDRLCAAPPAGEWISDVGAEYVIALTGSFLASVPSLDMATVPRAAYVQFIGGLAREEHERVHRTFGVAVKKLRKAGLPAPSAHDIQVVAMDVPGFASITAVASLLLKEFAAGHYREITGALLTRSLRAVVPGPIQRYVVADEYYLVPNARATMPLERFLDGDALALLSEGPPLLGGPPISQGIPGVPPLLLAPPDVPLADAETPLGLP